MNKTSFDAGGPDSNLPHLTRLPLAEEQVSLKYRNHGEEVVLSKALEVFSSNFFTRSQEIKELVELMKRHNISIEDLDEGLRRLDPEVHKKLTPLRVKEIRNNLKKDSLEKASGVLSKIPGKLQGAKNQIVVKASDVISQVPGKFEEVKGALADKTVEAGRAIPEKLESAKDLLAIKVQTIWSNLQVLLDQQRSLKEQIKRAQNALGELKKVQHILKEELKKELKASKAEQTVRSILHKFETQPKPISPERYALSLIGLVRTDQLSPANLQALLDILDANLGGGGPEKVEAVRNFVFFLNHPEAMPKSVRSRIKSVLRDAFGSAEDKSNARIKAAQTSAALIMHPMIHQLLQSFGSLLDQVAEGKTRTDIALNDLREEIQKMIKLGGKASVGLAEKEGVLSSSGQGRAPPVGAIPAVTAASKVKLDGLNRKNKIGKGEQEYIADFEAGVTRLKPKQYTERLFEILLSEMMTAESLPGFLEKMDAKLGKDPAKKEAVVRAFLNALDPEPAKTISRQEIARRAEFLANPLTKVILQQWYLTIRTYEALKIKPDLVELYDRVAEIVSI